MPATENEEILISVEDVGKKFCRSLKRSLLYGAQDSLADVFGSKRTHSHLRKDEFWANQNISFEVRRGECLGLIGHNGAGKTTLLKMLNGLIKPDCGQISIRGRASALIALGAGFNPVLTGRENIFVNGSILGLTRKYIDSKVDEIIDFAELHDSIDAPVQNYSSGMQVRLGFSVATILIDPDVLILDEVLAVGDIRFRTKCQNRIAKLLSKSAVILVSHNMLDVAKSCTEAILLSSGRIMRHSRDVPAIIELFEAEQTPNQDDGNVRFGAETLRLVSFSATSVGGTKPEGILDSATETIVDFVIEPRQPLEAISIILALYSDSAVPIALRSPEFDFEANRESRIRLRLPPTYLASGRYRCNIAFHCNKAGKTDEIVARYRGHHHLEFRGDEPLRYAIAHPVGAWETTTTTS